MRDMRLIFFDPCAGVAGSESGVSHKPPSRSSLDKSRPAAIQLAKSQETMAASGISFQHGGRRRSSLSGGVRQGGSGSCSSGEKGELSLGKVSALTRRSSPCCLCEVVGGREKPSSVVQRFIYKPVNAQREPQ